MKKSFFSFFLLGWLFCSSVFASTTSKPLLETIVQEKITVENTFDTSYNTVYQKFQSSIGSFLTSMNYQGLVCLWIINDALLLEHMQNDIKNLKIWFLNAYSALYTDALDIEQKQRIYQDTKVFLFSSGQTYETEKNRILSWITQLVASQKKLALQFQTSYETKIQTFVKDFKAYSDTNKELLNTITTHITTIQTIEEQYKKLTTNLLTYQSQLAGSWINFFSKLSLLKQASLSWLDVTFETMISKEVKKYKILPSLWSELRQQKIYALWLYDLQFDEKLNLLLDKWYDNKEFTQITRNTQKFLSTYTPSGKMQCTSFLASSDFSQESSRLLKEITSFSSSFTWVRSSKEFTTALSKRIPVIVQLQKDITTTYKTAIIQKKQLLLDAYKKQIWTGNSQVEILPSPSSSIISDFQFTQAFTKNQYHKDILILQQLLVKLWYYTWTVDGKYSSLTIDAVYRYQLAKWLLKWYEKKPQTWWWMGPATRASLNKDLLQ